MYAGKLVALFCDSDSLSLQVFEVQPGTGLPHSHRVSWQKDIGEATLSTLHFLQTERHTLRLEPYKAQPVLQLDAEAYASLHADNLRVQFTSSCLARGATTRKNSRPWRFRNLCSR